MEKSSFNTSTWTTKKLKTPCENFENWQKDKKEDDKHSKKKVYEYTSTTCKNLDENRALVTFSWWKAQKFVSKVGEYYEFDLNRGLWEVDENKAENKKEQTPEEKEKSQQMMKSMWIEMNYTMIFPWKIVHSDLWKVEWNKIKFSIFDIPSLDKVKKPVVRFKIEKTNWDIEAVPSILNFDSKTQLVKELSIARYNLTKTTKWKKFVKKIDLLVKKMNNKKKEELYNKLNKYDVNKKWLKKHKFLIMYIRAKLGLELMK
jgi:hypothetical protein